MQLYKLPCIFNSFRVIFLCHLQSIAAHTDHFVRCLSVRLSVCLSGSHTFLVVTHSYVSQATHAFLGMLPQCCIKTSKTTINVTHFHDNNWTLSPNFAWPRVGAWTGTLKYHTKCLRRWEPDHSSKFLNPPANLCAVTYITEISLHVTLSNQSHSLVYFFHNLSQKMY